MGPGWVASGLGGLFRADCYNLVTYHSIPMVGCGVAEPLQQWHYSWSYLKMNEEDSSNDTMIPYLLDIWVFPGLFVGC